MKRKIEIQKHKHSQKIFSAPRTCNKLEEQREKTLSLCWVTLPVAFSVLSRGGRVGRKTTNVKDVLRSSRTHRRLQPPWLQPRKCVPRVAPLPPFRRGVFQLKLLRSGGCFPIFDKYDITCQSFGSFSLHASTEVLPALQPAAQPSWRNVLVTFNWTGKMPHKRQSSLSSFFLPNSKRPSSEDNVTKNTDEVSLLCN